ncbi:MAG: glycosyltransferase [Deltaproteobacteria bacterium]|nr:glycosyltransferase [Deltaproteobacteria bacterium]
MLIKLPHRTYTILHTESSLGWGGQERRILAEAEAMQRRGHRVLLACDPRGELYRRAPGRGFSPFPLACGGLNNLGAWWRLRRLLQEQKIDVLNTHSSLDSWLGALAWRSLKERPCLVRTRHLSTRVKSNLPTRWLYRTPAAIITTGEVTRDLLGQRLGVPESRLFSIPTGVPLEQFAPREKDAALQARLLIPPGAFVFGTVAVLRSWKGHLYLLEALAEMVRGGEPAYFLVVGDGPYRVVIEAKVRELNLSPWVRLAGYQDAVAPWFALMDAVVLASYANEGVPQSLLQAMAMGQAVVGTTVGGIPEVVIEGETGLLAPPRDGAALARALRLLREDTVLRRELGRRGRELVAERFSIEQMAAEVEAVYEEVSGEQ